MKTVAEKMGVKPHSRVYFQNPPDGIIAGLSLPPVDIVHTLHDSFDYIHLFVHLQKDQEALFPRLKEHLNLSGMLWVSWPKGRQLRTDLSLPHVVRIGYRFGLVESTCLSVNATWSALKFTHPKKGKIYKNSHAELTSRTTNR